MRSADRDASFRRHSRLYPEFLNILGSGLADAFFAYSRISAEQGSGHLLEECCAIQEEPTEILANCCVSVEDASLLSLQLQHVRWMEHGTLMIVHGQCYFLHRKL